MSELDRVASISRTSLHEELTERLRNMIVEGVLAAGEKVPERELCEKLDVSRTPMREALKVLAADGLINLEPNRGARVRALTLADLDEMFPILAAFESLAGELACDRITDKQLKELKKAHEQMLKHFQNENMPAYFKQNERIHNIILDATDNQMLKSLHRSLSMRIRSARYLANMTPTRWHQAVDEHEEILIALENRNGKSLGAILKRHLENKYSSARHWLENQQEQDTVESQN